MPTLGEAYIAVKADMRPFTRDLKTEVEKVVDDVEKNVHKGLTDSLSKGAHEAGGRAGEQFSSEFDRSTRKHFGNKDEKKPWMLRIAAALASALDDGISALPMHAKAAIVGGILLALPLISGALAATFSGAVGIGFATLGTVLAFQYDVVRQKATDTFSALRVQLARLAEPFVAETLKGLDQITLAFQRWEPLLRRIFVHAAFFVEPLTRGALGAFDRILKAVSDVAAKLDPFVDEFALGFETIGAAVGEFIRLMAATGDEGRLALRDLIKMTADFIVNLGRLIYILAEVYGWIRKIATTVPFLTSLIGLWWAQTDQAAEATDLYGSALDDLNYQVDGNILATQRQTEAMNKLITAMESAYNEAFKLIDAQIAYEEAVDRLTESLKENGNTFNIKTKEGRENLRNFEAALKAVHEQVIGLLAEGKINAEQGKQMQDELTAAIYKQASAAGANTDALHAMFDQAMAFGDIPVGDQAWLDAIQAKAKATSEALAQAAARAAALNGSIAGGKGTRIFSEYAEGGIVNGPQAAIIGEAGPEVVIPLTKPGRAAQLAQQSGLASMLGLGSNAPTVYVFIGNDQLDSYMVQVVDRNNQAMGTAMTYGARGL